MAASFPSAALPTAYPSLEGAVSPFRSPFKETPPQVKGGFSIKKGQPHGRPDFRHEGIDHVVRVVLTRQVDAVAALAPSAVVELDVVLDPVEGVFSKEAAICVGREFLHRRSGDAIEGKPVFGDDHRIRLPGIGHFIGAVPSGIGNLVPGRGVFRLLFLGYDLLEGQPVDIRIRAVDRDVGLAVEAGAELNPVGRPAEIGLPGPAVADFRKLGKRPDGAVELHRAPGNDHRVGDSAALVAVGDREFRLFRIGVGFFDLDLLEGRVVVEGGGLEVVEDDARGEARGGRIGDRVLDPVEVDRRDEVAVAVLLEGGEAGPDDTVEGDRIGGHDELVGGSGVPVFPRPGTDHLLGNDDLGVGFFVLRVG